MKKLLSLTALTLGLALPVQAQWEVYDPAVHTQIIIDHVEDVAKFVEMIQKQVEQINTLTAQLQEIQHYVDLFGDPAKISKVVGADVLIKDLQSSSIGQTLGELQGLADGVQALNYNANGLYHNIGGMVSTPAGNQIPRNEKDYRPFAAINKTTENYNQVYADVLRRREVLKEEIAAATEQLEAATTDAETQKLSGVLVGLHADLSAVDKEVDQALGLTLVQDAENRNDKEKQAQARIEEQQAAFTESIKNYSGTFKLSAEPPAFPEE
jgi:hypothetical protein